MKIYLDCYPCILRQALEASRMVTDDPKVQKNVLLKTMNTLSTIDENTPFPEPGQIIHRWIKKVSSNPDPYKKLKQKYNKIAMDMYPKLKEIVKASDEPLLTATKIAIAGNIIDFAANSVFNLEDTLEDALNADLAINDYALFKETIEKSDKIVYLGDNAGEIVFDRILVEEIDNNNLIFVVRGEPVINDATLEDAFFASLDKIAKVISNGSDAPGTLLDDCSEEVLNEYNSADMIIAKGQGNFESLSDEQRGIFFLLKAKCPVIGDELGVDVGSIVLTML